MVVRKVCPWLTLHPALQILGSRPAGTVLPVARAFRATKLQEGMQPNVIRQVKCY